MMEMKEYAKGTALHRTGEPVDKLELIVKGQVRAAARYGEMMLKSGNIVGLLPGEDKNYPFDYTAQEDVTLCAYEFRNIEDARRMIGANPKISATLVSAAVRQLLDMIAVYTKLKDECDAFYRFVKDGYEEYKSLCRRFKLPIQSFPLIEELEPLNLEDELNPWVVEYYRKLEEIPQETRKLFYTGNTEVCLGTILDTVMKMREACDLCMVMSDYLAETTGLLMNSGAGDFFDLYSNLVFKASQNPFNDTIPVEAAVSRIIIYLQGNTYIERELLDHRLEEYREGLRKMEEQLFADEPEEGDEKAVEAAEELEDSLMKILRFAEFEEEERENFRMLLDRYEALTDKNSQDDGPRKLRKDLSALFYTAYERAFFRSLKQSNIPAAVKMFFYFGYMDESLIGESNARCLYELTEQVERDKEEHVYTAYDWLRMIYNGQREPSRNEFDLDYPAYLREQARNGYINEAQEKKMLRDPAQMVRYEIKNMFQSTNRITFGRVTTFCPILSEHNVLKSLQGMFVRYDSVVDAILKLRQIDYSAFFREILYTKPEIGVNREYVEREVLPDVILMPNVGSRGIMWQEIAGRKKDSPARMAVSIFNPENMDDLMTRLIGELRWELCRRIQGVHWNDLSDPSLTAEYCDYLQFYRRNRELSSDAKEKIKLGLQKAKGNSREMFTRDYIDWIKYEGKGSPRLNRQARTILFKYCPFSRAVREKIRNNPLYREVLEYHELKANQKLHSLEMVCKKIVSGGHQIPSELEAQKKFLLM